MKQNENKYSKAFKRFKEGLEKEGVKEAFIKSYRETPPDIKKAKEEFYESLKFQDE